ncbi:hypothetical protein HPP92_002811 [Vanilla planifolia]|uniref:ATP-dependent Clp protease proteolytic subunit n=1 Tax=Vanilla planifolia TaxID=51239 RepID=A0A835S704_VANPL|nr:hypothetical protein HPP92_002811 [Vanilla planifolia]
MLSKNSSQIDGIILSQKHFCLSIAFEKLIKELTMGAFILSSGTKGKRFSLPNTRIMIHQPIGGGQGTQTEMGNTGK